MSERERVLRYGSRELLWSRGAGERGSSGANEESAYFNPLHVLGNKISVSDIDGLKILNLSQHPDILVQIDVMKTEVITYQNLADSIATLVYRKDGKQKDTFDISDWWKANCAKLPAFTYVLRAALTKSRNYCL
jgi:hypothetical protein